MNWIPLTPSTQPPAAQVVLTKIDDDKGVRHQLLLKRCGKLWFHPEGGLFTPHTPTHWAYPVNIDTVV